jgi:hypothetical protein
MSALLSYYVDSFSLSFLSSSKNDSRRSLSVVKRVLFHPSLVLKGISP